MNMLYVFDDPALDGPTNMARDEHLLYSDGFRPATLRLYAWSPPTISLGYFQRYEDIAALPDELRGLAVVRRTTGGGAILHDQEITYCLVLDDSTPFARQSPVALYRLVHEAWRSVLAADGTPTELASAELPLPTPRSGPFFCFEKPGQTDLLLHGAKVLGSAQRRIPGRVLQHGSLMLRRTFAAHPGAVLAATAEQAARWRERFAQRVAEMIGLRPELRDWTRDMLADVTQRTEKYASDEWLRRR